MLGVEESEDLDECASELVCASRSAILCPLSPSPTSPVLPAALATHHTHPLDSLLTPAASPEEDSLEPWIQTV